MMTKNWFLEFCNTESSGRLEGLRKTKNKKQKTKKGSEFMTIEVEGNQESVLPWKPREESERVGSDELCQIRCRLRIDY